MRLFAGIRRYRLTEAAATLRAHRIAAARGMAPAVDAVAEADVVLAVGTAIGGGAAGVGESPPLP